LRGWNRCSSHSRAGATLEEERQRPRLMVGELRENNGVALAPGRPARGRELPGAHPGPPGAVAVGLKTEVEMVLAQDDGVDVAGLDRGVVGSTKAL